MTSISVPITYEGKTVQQLLLATELNQLVPGRIYWITDAFGNNEGGWVYAQSTSVYTVFPRPDRFVRDVHAFGHALILDNDSGTLSGLIAADLVEEKLWVIGTDTPNPLGYDDANRPVELAGSILSLHAPAIEMLLVNAEVGAPVEIGALDSNGLAVLRAGIPPTPSFVVSDSDNSDIIVPTDDSWQLINVQISDLPQSVAIGARISYALHVIHPGDADGSLVVGFEIEDVVGNPGVWSALPTTLTHTILHGSNSLYTGAFKGAQELPLGANVRMRVRASVTIAPVYLGSRLFAGSTIANVSRGQFRTDSISPAATTQIRLHREDSNRVDYSSDLEALAIGSPLRMFHGSGITTYTVDARALATNYVTFTVSGFSGDNTNWNGDVSFEGQLASGSPSFTIAGSQYPQQLEILLEATGSGGIDALRWQGKDLHSSFSAPSDGDIPVFRVAGDSWVLEAKPVGGASPALADLTDVIITAVSDNEPLGYDTVSGKWTNQTPAELGLAAELHTHLASAITDSSVAGRALLTALDAPAQRALLNVEDGAAADQTGAEIEGLLDAQITHTDWRRAVGTGAGDVAAGDHDHADRINLYIDAGACVPPSTNGAAAIIVEKGAIVSADGYAFDAITEEKIQFKFTMPDRWDQSAIRARIVWISDTGGSLGDVVTWLLTARHTQDGDTLDAAFPAGVSVADIVQSDTVVHHSDPLPALTIGGTPGTGNLVLFEIRRILGDPQELAQDALFLGIHLQIGLLDSIPTAW